MPEKTINRCEQRIADAVGTESTYGGLLLKESAQCVNRKLLSSLSKSGKNDLSDFVKDWEDLVDEVLCQYRMEREILRHNLAIKEYRPRTFFSVLPEMQTWKRLDTEHRNFEVWLRTLNGTDKRRRGTRRRQLALLIPIHNGYRRTFRSLACLCYDVDNLAADYDIHIHTFVNFSDDNSLYEVLRFATTLARSRALPVTIYSAEDKTRRGSEGRQGRWWKTVAINIMLERIVAIARREKRRENQYFLHFADDDIVIAPDKGVVSRNIERLKENKLKIVSACYSSDETVGFSLVTSVRKLREFVYLPEGGPLLNLYGGCMTTTLAKLREVVGARRRDAISLPSMLERQEFGEDSYLTIASNFDMLIGEEAREMVMEEELGGYANRSNLVGHREPTNPVDAAKRLLRDQEWCPQAAGAALASRESRGNANELSDKFLKLRRATFNAVTEAIVETGDKRKILAQWWWGAFRHHVRVMGVDSDTIPKMQGLDWTTHKTQHQICKEICQDRGVLETIYNELVRGPFGREVVRAANDCLSAGENPFAEFCRLLGSRPYHGIKECLVRNPHLYHLYNIAVEAVSYAEQFLSHAEPAAYPPQFSGADDSAPRETMGDLLKHYPLCLGKVLQEAFPSGFSATPRVGSLNGGFGAGELDYVCSSAPSSPLSYNMFLTRANGVEATNCGIYDSLFLRYYSVIGRSRFHEDSPRRLVYLHTLGQEIVRRIIAKANKTVGDAIGDDCYNDGDGDGDGKIPELCLVRTLYPTLKQALVNYAGPEQRSPFARFMQAIYFQESIKSRGKPVSRTVLWDSQCSQLAGCAGKFLGEMHGASLGLRQILERVYLGKEAPERRGWQGMEDVVRVLVAHLDQLRLFNPSAYRRWLREGSRQGRSLGGIVNIAKEPGTIGGRVEGLIRQDGLQVGEVWREICRESEEFHQLHGAVGHLGFTGRNVFVDRRGPGWHDRKLQDRSILGAEPEARIVRVWLASHFSVAMVDPAIEAGLTLADLVSWRLCSNVLMRQCGEEPRQQLDDSSLTRIVDRFREVYFKVLTLASKRISIGKSAAFAMDELMYRVSKFAAVALINRYHASEEYELTEAERVQLIHVCVDLLQVGNTLQLHFREMPPSEEFDR